jgi:hypothetical protein
VKLFDFAFLFVCKCIGLKKHQLMFFIIFFNNFDILMLNIKKSDRIIFMFFKRITLYTFDKHLTPQY